MIQITIKKNHAILSSHDFMNNQFTMDHTMVNNKSMIETKHIC